MNTPEELLYSKSHEWVRIEGNEAVIGITDFAQDALGDITYVDLPQVDDSFEQEQEMGAVESVKAASELYMPIACKVLEINEALDESPDLVNADPYGKGWMCRVSFTETPSGLISAAEYDAFCASA